MFSSKSCSQTIRICGKGFNHAFPGRVTNIAQNMAKHDKIFYRYITEGYGCRTGI